MKYKYIGSRDEYPIPIQGRTVRKGDIIELSKEEFEKLHPWDFELVEEPVREVESKNKKIKGDEISLKFGEQEKRT